jgi:hypothetical protein
MKNVLLIKDGRFLWQTVEIYLGGINAAVRAVGAGASEEEIAGEDADLLILGMEQYRSRGGTGG